MSQRLSGVNVNRKPGTVSARSHLPRFAARPLGLLRESRYIPGRRAHNEPFGDTRWNWDSIPTAGDLYDQPHSRSRSPVRTEHAEGALSIRTRAAPSIRERLRRSREIVRAALDRPQHGGANRRGSIICERERLRETAGASSRLRRAPILLKLRRQDGTTDIDFSITHAIPDLTGNAAAAEHAPSRPAQAGLYARRPIPRTRDLFSLMRPAGLPRNLLGSGTALSATARRTRSTATRQTRSATRATASFPYEDGDPTVLGQSHPHQPARLPVFRSGRAPRAENGPGRSNLVILWAAATTAVRALRQSYRLGWFQRRPQHGAGPARKPRS